MLGYDRLESTADIDSFKYFTMSTSGVRPCTRTGAGQEEVLPLHKMIDGTIAEAAKSSAARKEREQKSMRDTIYNNPTAELRTSQDAKVQESPPQECQNIENGDPNVCSLASPPSATERSIPSIDSADNLSIAGAVPGGESRSGIGRRPALLVDQLQQESAAIRRGGSTSARWRPRNAEDGVDAVPKSSRTGGCDSFGTGDERGSGFSACVRGNISDAVGNAQNPPPSSHHQQHSPGSWAARGGLHREAAALPRPRDACVHGGCGVHISHKVVKSQQENRSCVMHGCGEACQAHRSFLAKNFASHMEKPPIAVTQMQPQQQQQQQQMDANGNHGSACIDGSGGLTRSYSSRELKPSIENWSRQTATRSLRGCSEKCHRVSFPGMDPHELDHELRQRAKWKEPIPHTRKMLSAKHAHPDLRYNYEQPGFVDRETEVSGKPYTIYGVRNNKEPSKSSHSRPQKFVRAFSVREQQSSNYTRISRAMSVNGSGRNVLPVECVTCGQGIGVVVFGPSDESCCQSCRTSNSRVWTCSRDRERSSTEKKKGIMDFCRKLLKFPRKHK